jgi:ribose transport system permease protein
MSYDVLCTRHHWRKLCLAFIGDNMGIKNSIQEKLSVLDMKNGRGRRIKTIAALILVYLIMGIVTKNRFLTGTNLLAVLSNSVVNAFIVLGFCFIFATGIIDLSIGAILVLACNIGGILAVKAGLGYAGLIAGSVIVAVILELFNMKLIQVSRIPAWIFGLGMAMVYEAVGAIYNSHQIAAGLQAVSLSDSCRALGQPPVNILLLAAGVVTAFLIYNKSTAGIGIRAVGSNKEVAGMMGINTSKTIILSGIIGGIFIGLAAAINESYAGRVVPSTGLNSITLIFIPLAAYLLALAFSKTFNLTIAAALSSFIITSIFNVLTIMGVPTGTWQKVIMGASVIICGILSARTEKGDVK